MSITNGWGQGVQNNTIEWGRGGTNASNNWGAVYTSSDPGQTILNAETFSNVYSVDFDGVDDYIDLGNPTALQFTSSFSISLWFKSSDTTDYILISKDKTNGHLTNERSWGLWGNRYGGTSVIIFNIRSGSSGFSVAGTTDYNDGSWHHVVATFEASTNLKLYVDGSLEAENPQWNLPATINNVTTNVGIGTSIGSNFWYMNGKVDEVGLFNSVLSASDVTAIYNSGTPQSLDDYSPVGYWRFEEGSGTTATDSSANNNDGTLTNGVTYSTDKP